MDGTTLLISAHNHHSVFDFMERVEVLPDHDPLYIETERLILRRLTMDDAEVMFALDSDPIVMKYIGVPPHISIDQNVYYINRVLKQYAEFGCGRLAVVEKCTGECIGWGGVKFDTEGENGLKNHYDIGYRLLPNSWGKGLGTEVAKASLRHGFEVLKAPYIVGFAFEDNVASCRILEKIGLQKKGKYLCDGVPCVWYEISSEQYLLARDPSNTTGQTTSSM